VWNIVTVGSDDDAQSADPISEDQALRLHDMLNHLAMTPPQMSKFWAFVDPSGVIKTVEAIQRRDYERVAGALKQRCKAGAQ
jgi:hypothetical protein